MEKIFYFDKGERKLVSFNLQKVIYKFNQQQDFEVQSIVGTTVGNKMLTLESATCLFESAEHFQRGESIDINSITFPFHKFYHKLYGRTFNRDSFYDDHGNKIDPRDCTFVLDAVKGDMTIEGFEDVKMFFPSWEAYVFVNPLKIEDETGETSIPSKRDKCIITDKQMEIVEKMRVLAKEAKDAGLRFGLDDYDDLFAYNGNALGCGYDCDTENEDTSINKWAWDDDRIKSHISDGIRIYEDMVFYLKESE